LPVEGVQSIVISVSVRSYLKNQGQT